MPLLYNSEYRRAVYDAMEARVRDLPAVESKLTAVRAFIADEKRYLNSFYPPLPTSNILRQANNKLNWLNTPHNIVARELLLEEEQDRSLNDLTVVW